MQCSTVIALRGVGESGKTTSLRRVWRKLNARPGIQMIARGRGTREIMGGVLKVDGVLVGFMTKSEPASMLAEVLDSLIEFGCTVLVCATRSKDRTKRRGSLRVVRNLRARGWLVRWVDKHRDWPNEEEQGNRKCAAKTIREILAAVKRALPAKGRQRILTAAC